MKKIIKTLGLAFLFTSFFSLSGCGSKTKDTTEESTTSFELKHGVIKVDFSQPGIVTETNYISGDFELFAGNKKTFHVKADYGYNFLGWYVNNELVSTDTSYTVTCIADTTLNVVPKAEPYEELKNFVFQGGINKGYSDGTEYYEEGVFITDVKDKTVEEIVVPEYVIGISGEAFSGCHNLKKLTIPRIGSYEPEEGTDNDSRFLHFGYMFDNEEYEGSILAESSSNYYSYYIPASLEEVVLTNTEYIPTEAFYGYNNDLIIPISVRTIDNFAISIGNGNRIFYEGSSSEWSNITIGTQSSSYSSILKYNYSRVTPTTAGNFWHYDSNRDPQIWL